MATLRVVGRAFTGKFSSLNRVRILDVTEEQVLKFAMTMGLPALAVATPTIGHAITMAFYKAIAIKCAVDFGSDELSRPLEFENLDASEKANISYWTGMTLASLVADEALGVAQLIHAESLRKMGLLTGLGTSKSLADLVGMDSFGDFHVVEAKARQAGPGPQLHSKWKAQAESVTSVQGLAPATRSYALTRIGTPYSVELVDPPDEASAGARSYVLSENAVVAGYYGPIIEWLTATLARATARVFREGTELILRQAAYDAVSGRILFLGMTAEAFSEVREHRTPARRQAMKLADGYLGSDGIVIVTSTSLDLL